MTNKDFITELSLRAGVSTDETAELVTSLISGITQQLQDGNVCAMPGFGNFEVKRKAERIIVNPSSKQRMLVPPKLVLNFKPAVQIKDKFKEISHERTN